MMSEDQPEAPKDSGAETETKNEKETKEDVSVPNPAGSLSWYTSWGSSFLQSAKEKTLATYDLVKKDLGEFTEVVSQEAKTVASSTTDLIYEGASNLGKFVQDQPTEPEEKDLEGKDLLDLEEEKKEKDDGQGILSSATAWVNPASAGKWVKSLADTMNKALVIEDTTEGEEKFEIPLTSKSLSLSESRLLAIQSDVGTYTNEPEGAHELFDDWLESFSLEEKDGEISELLGKNPQIRTIFAQLVPSQVSNGVFWSRYFYKLHQFQLDEARRASLLQRSSDSDLEAEKERLRNKTSWDDSEEEDNAAINKLLEDEFGHKVSPIPEPVTQQPTQTGAVAEKDIPKPAEEEKPENLKTELEKEDAKFNQDGETKQEEPYLTVTPAKPSALGKKAGKGKGKKKQKKAESKEEKAEEPMQSEEKSEVEPNHSKEEVKVNEQPHEAEAETSEETTATAHASESKSGRSSANLSFGGNGGTSDGDSWSVCSGREMIEEIPSPESASVLSGGEEDVKEETPEPGKRSEGTTTPQKVKEERKPSVDSKDGDDWVDWDD